MTPSELKRNVKENNQKSHFFDRASMAFFGDTMKNYGVRSAKVKTQYNSVGAWTLNGAIVDVWELYRKNPINYGLQKSAYFCKNTFNHIHEAD